MTHAPIRHVLVVVPARDETQRISRCLDSVNASRRNLPPGVSSTIVVVADSCTDATVATAIAKLSDPSDVVLDVHAGSAGRARHLGTERGLVDLPLEPCEIWIANTDADTVVPADWLVRQLVLASAGVDAVAGVVELDRSTCHDEELLGRFARHYVLDPDASVEHVHVHGANLGFTAAAYRAVGGWKAIATGEDHDLWGRLLRTVTSRATRELIVVTDARLVGRAPDGFAADLAGLVDPFLLEPNIA